MRNAYMKGKDELAWGAWPNRLVLKLSLQSGNKTNDLLKSGPAKAGPAGLATLPQHCNKESLRSSQKLSGVKYYVIHVIIMSLDYKTQCWFAIMLCLGFASPD